MTVRDDYVREQIMQASGTPLRFAIRPGTGTGPPLLLCNGIGMRLEAFQPFVDALDPAIEVIRFDTPGTGGSQLPNRPYCFTTLALLLREMLQNLGRQQADVLGISWGGALAQQFALLNPRRCRRLILVATSTGPQTMVPPNPLPPVKNLILRRWGDLWGGSAKTDPDALASALRKARISPLSIGYLYQHTAALGFTTAAAAAAHPPAHLGAHRRRRPDHPGGQRPHPGRGHPARDAAHLPRRPRRAGDPPEPAHAPDHRLPRVMTSRKTAAPPLLPRQAPPAHDKWEPAEGWIIVKRSQLQSLAD